MLSHHELPFHSLTDFELNQLYQSSKNRFQTFYKSHNLIHLLRESLPDHFSQKVDCKYYHIDRFNQNLQDRKPKFSLYHHNIRSLNKHRTELQTFLECLNLKFDVIALTEVGKTNALNHLSFFDNYTCLLDPSTANFGGACLLIKNEIKIVSERHDLCLPQFSHIDSNYMVENKWVELKIPYMKKNIIVGVIYRHPKGNIDLFNTHLEKQFLQLIRKTNSASSLVT